MRTFTTVCAVCGAMATNRAYASLGPTTDTMTVDLAAWFCDEHVPVSARELFAIVVAECEAASP